MAAVEESSMLVELKCAAIAGMGVAIYIDAWLSAQMESWGLEVILTTFCI